MNEMNNGILNRSNHPWIFMDAGDTFIYGYPTFYTALCDWFRRSNLSLSPEQANTAVRGYLNSTPPPNFIDQESFTRFLHAMYRGVLKNLQFPGDIEEGVEWLWNEWLKGDRIRLFDDSLSSLLRLRSEGFRLGIISNWDETFPAILERLQVAHLFDFIVASVQVGLAKPDPRLFQHALQQTGATPESSWYLGDQLEVDIQPAVSLGFRTIYVDYYARGGGDHLALYHVPSMSVAVERICSVKNDPPTE